VPVLLEAWALRGLPLFAQRGSAMPGIRAPEMHGKQYLIRKPEKG
jgi:hypothetical protein